MPTYRELLQQAKSEIDEQVAQAGIDALLKK